MPKALLTTAVIAATKCPPGRSKLEFWDSQISGLTFERRASGEGTWYLRFTSPADGRQRQLKICRERDATCSQVRKRAQQLKSEVAMGGDPAAKKAEGKAIPQFREIAAQYLAYAKLHLRDHQSVEIFIRVHANPRFGKLRVNDITRTAVAEWLAEKRAAGLAPATVLKLRSMLSRSYELSAQAGVPGCDKNPTKGLPRVRLRNARDRFLSADEAVRLRAAVAASQNPQLQHIVGLLLLTGARLRELLDARWENVDVERQSWFIPDSKTGRSRYVPLSKPAVAIVTALPRFKGCPWLIPNPDTLKPFVSIKHGWQRALKVAKLPGLRIHDLRHSAASFMCAANIDLYSIGKILGHASLSSTARYSHLNSQALLLAVESGAAKQVA